MQLRIQGTPQTTPHQKSFSFRHLPSFKQNFKTFTKKDKIFFKIALEGNIYIEEILHKHVCGHYNCTCTHVEIYTIP